MFGFLREVLKLETTIHVAICKVLNGIMYISLLMSN